MISPQLLMFTGCGATKSFTSAVNEGEDRLFRNTLPKALHVEPKIPAAVRLIAASPKVFAASVRGAPGLIGSVTETVLMAPSESVEFRSTWFPQHGSELAEKHWFV